MIANTMVVGLRPSGTMRTRGGRGELLCNIFGAVMPLIGLAALSGVSKPNLYELVLHRSPRKLPARTFSASARGVAFRGRPPLRQHVRGIRSRCEDTAREPDDVHQFLRDQNIFVSEGYSSRAQRNFLQELVRNNSGIKRVIEIGFNAGHSAECFLEANDQLELVSFDIGEHGYTTTAHEWLQRKYPGRSTLILGDSTKSMPQFRSENPEFAADLVFIDGGHIEPVPYLDIVNGASMSNDGALVILDDYCEIYGSEGVMEAWEKAKDEGIVHQIGMPHTWKDRGWVVGRYIR
eukprot:jgi/Bigna1/87202/estExt_fgenesh1_pg.C_170194